LNPIKSITSRYANKIISPNSYSTINISGISGTTLIGQKGGTNPGYIYAPYIMMESNSITDREYSRKILRAERKEKLKKLGWS
jgi:hypothetical protein